jgi:hypothetical protein
MNVEDYATLHLKVKVKGTASELSMSLLYNILKEYPKEFQAIPSTSDSCVKLLFLVI